MPTPADTSPQDTGTLATATNAFEKILDREDGTEQPKKAKRAEPSPQPEEEVDEPEDDEPSDEGESPEETDDEPDDEPEDDAEDEEADDDEAELPAEVTVKIDGKSEKVSLDEVIKGYQRQADYTRKTEALAHERRAFFEQEVAPVREERQTYAQLLAAMEQQLTAAPQVDWDRLWQEDPIEWVRQRELHKDKETKLSAARYEQQRLQAQQIEEQQQHLARHLKQEKQRLTDLIPEAADATRWEPLRQQIREYGLKAGYSPEELGQAYDARAIAVMVKAMKYDKLMQSKKPAPDPVKPAKQVERGRTVAPKAVTQLTRAKQRLAKTGKLSDAAAVFEKLI